MSLRRRFPSIAPLLGTVLLGTAGVAQTNRLAPVDPALIGFGAAVAVAGDQVLVGRTGQVPGFPMPASETGAIHVFGRRGAGWAEVAALKASGATIADGFGGAIAVAGDLLVAGAPDANGHAGRVYVYARRQGQWSEVASVAGQAAGDRFGAALAVTGDLVVVGAPGRENGRGAAYLVRVTGGRPGEPQLFGSGTADGDRMGFSVAIEGNRIAVGAPGEIAFGNGAGAGRPGWVGLYSAAGGTATESGRLTADSTGAFGGSVAFAGADLVVGAPITGRGVGAVYHFAGGTGTGHKLVPSDLGPGSLFGLRLAAFGADLLASAPVATGGVGAVYAFTRGGPLGYTQKQRIAVRPSGLGTMFGAGLAGAGDLAVVGGPMAEFFEGLGWVYGREGGEWKELGTVADRPASMTAITGGERKCQPGGGDIEGFSCKEVDLAAFIPTAALGAKRGIMINDLWGWTDPETNREYALVGKMDGTVFVDVTDPTNPRVLGELPLHQGAQVNLWRDIKTYKNHAFIVSDGAGPHGMQIFDLTQLRTVANPPVTFKETAHYDKMASAHNIVIDEATGFAYTVGNSAGGETCGGALHIIDVRDPKNPVFAGCHSDPATGNARTGYTHDAQCVVYHGPDQRYAGREVCFNASETAVGIADVTDKKAPKPIAVAAYPNTSYAHQGWLTDDHKYFFLDDEGDEIAGTAAKTRTMIWDVTKLDEPVLVKEFLGTTAASDHNLYIKGNYVFQSNYVAGLRILDISDPTNPRETGYFDTVPFGENVPGFAGSWSNYPYFKSGTILVTSMREGLFILKHRPERPVP
ncbi:MAG: choice-of-anchor B family protein [Gemmatimonadales bacterium]